MATDAGDFAAVAVSPTRSALVDWIERSRQTNDMTVERITFRDSEEWRLDDGRIVHRTGGFFSIVGLGSGESASDEITQPMIHQPEIGLLGFVTHGTGDDMRVLVQSKAEPGNVNLVQAAPSVQATRSNYLRRHGGLPTPLLDLFDDTGGEVLADSLQSEQGTRFLGKYNRNMTVRVDRAPEDLPDQLRWFPVSELLESMHLDSFVNTDARSVVACAPWEQFLPDGRPFRRWEGTGHFGALLAGSYHCDEAVGTATTMRWLARLRLGRRLHTRQLPVDAMPGWRLDDWGLANHEDPSLSVQFARVRTTQREVEKWDQPLMASPSPGAATLLCQVRGGVLRFLFVARPEPGFVEGRQLGPSQLVPPGRDRAPTAGSSAEAEMDDLAASATPIVSITQSDEGGRFWTAETRYTIARLDDEVVPVRPDRAWLTLRQLRELIPRQGLLTNESRTLVSMLAAYL